MGLWYAWGHGLQRHSQPSESLDSSGHNLKRRHDTDERALLKRARKYDEDALGELYDRYAPAVYAYLYRRVGDAQLAEDLTGETFVRMLQAIQSERSWHTSFRAWLYRIAHNVVVDDYRRRQRMPLVSLDGQPVVADGDPDSAMIERWTWEQLRQAMGCLTEDQQQVLVLRFGEQLPSRQVAEVMEKSVGAVEALQHRALAALRRILGEEW